jgi:hypothetical protein
MMEIRQLVLAQNESWLAALATPLARAPMSRVVLSDARRTW